jgi:hypothetical protein
MNVAVLNGHKPRGLKGLGCGCGCNSCGSSSGLGATPAPPVINWDTAPDTSADGRKVTWSCNDWTAWHKKVADKYGVPRATEVFSQWWDKQVGLFDTRNFCEMNCGWADYLEKAGAWDTSFVANLNCKSTKAVKDVTNAAADTISNVATGAKGVSGVLKWALPAAGILILAGGGFYVYKHYIKGNKKLKAA